MTRAVVDGRHKVTVVAISHRHGYAYVIADRSTDRIRVRLSRLTLTGV